MGLPTVQEENEILDLVDQTDNVIGVISRKDIPSLFGGSGRYVRYAECFIRNSSGKLWIPRRQLDKTIAPGGLDFSASEHVQAGETYLDAIIRGLSEELNLDIDPTHLRKIGKLSPTSNRPFFCEIYLLKRDEVPMYNKKDFSNYEWLSTKELLTKLKQGEVAKLDLEDAARQMDSFDSPV